MGRSLIILGDGQLAGMLALAGSPLDGDIRICSDQTSSPAQKMASSPVIRSNELSDFLQESSESLCLIESEFFNFASAGGDVQKRMFPRYESVQKLKNKVFQKQTAEELKIDQPKFQPLNFDQELEPQLKSEPAWVLKWAEQGYDGYGNFHWQRDSGDPNALAEFLKKARQKKVSLFAEEFVDFDCELAITGTRGRSGDIIFYPLVMSLQKNQACWQVRGPALEYGIASEIEKRAQEGARRLVESCDFEGSFSMEFFYKNEDQKLLFNEFAPRVHNSAHYSVIRPTQSQFANHLRAAMNQDLEVFESPPFFGMYNLLSPYAEGASLEQTTQGSPQGELVWYGKKDFRLGRKMGHIHFEAPSKVQLEEMFRMIQDWEIQFWESMKG